RIGLRLELQDEGESVMGLPPFSACRRSGLVSGRRHLWGVKRCSPLIQGVSGLARPRAPSRTARTQQADYADTGPCDLFREQRPRDPPLRRTILPLHVA